MIVETDGMSDYQAQVTEAGFHLPPTVDDLPLEEVLDPAASPPVLMGRR